LTSQQNRLKQAQNAGKQVKKGNHVAKDKKVWTKVTFRRPKTLQMKRAPKVLPHSYEKQNTNDKYAIIKFPRSSESAIKITEDFNTLVFIVAKTATKPQIRKACEDLYQIKVRKVNTMITCRGEKKAYVMLKKEFDALEVANKIGIM